MTGSEILAAVYEHEASVSRFDPREPRISRLGTCARRQVAEALGFIESTIPWELGEAGHLLEDAAFYRILSRHDDTVHEPRVQTWLPGVWCHPDIAIPSLGLCIQVKSVLASRNSWGEVPPYHRDQVLGEWAAWRHSGGSPMLPRPWVPERYEILYLDRETFGKIHCSVPVPWDGARVRLLQEKFRQIAAHIFLGVLPEIPKTKQPDCFLGQKCPIYNDCWED